MPLHESARRILMFVLRVTDEGKVYQLPYDVFMAEVIAEFGMDQRKQTSTMRFLKGRGLLHVEKRISTNFVVFNTNAIEKLKSEL